MIDIYYDGLSKEKYMLSTSKIKGFTTNCSIFSTSNDSYRRFYDKISEYLNNRPISFQIWEDVFELQIKQVDDIHSIDSNIFVKVPVINSSGNYNEEIIKYIIEHRIPLNITAIYTKEQINKIEELLKSSSSPIIISIFAGPISDIGIDPVPYIRYAKGMFSMKNNIKILWAGCRELYSVYRAIDSGCDIITIPDGVIEKIESIHKTLNELSVERVNKFKLDAINKHVKIL
jgi:transaldolase